MLKPLENNDTSTDLVFKARKLSVGYSDRVIWSNANLEVKPGEFVGILGPNGAGKTTLIRLLLGLIKPLGGEIELFGAMPERGNSKIGYVPQRHQVDQDVKIQNLEVVRLGLSGTKWGPGIARAADERRQALNALKLVDAEQLAYRSLGEMSGGEAQRIFLAQALVGKPQLLLLDEPLANLDIKREVKLLNLIANVAKKQNVAVILIAHDINPLLPVVERIIYIANGKVASGATKDVITSESLSKLYDAPIEVIKDSRGRLAVLGVEEAIHHDD